MKYHFHIIFYEVYIKYPNIHEIENVHLINILGQTIYTWNKKDFNTTDAIRIPVKTISEGIYIIKATTDSSSFEKKVIIRN